MFSNYCGFGGSGKIKHKVDAICKQHDDDYKQIQSEHGYITPYVKFNWADKKMLDALARVNPGDLEWKQRVLKSMAENLWNFKSKFSSELAESNTQDSTTGKMTNLRRPEPVTNKAGTSDDVEIATNLRGTSALTSGVGGSKIAHETPVSKVPRAPYGPVGETYTTIMPYYTSFNGEFKGTGDPCILRLRMNSINDIINNTLSLTDANGTVITGGTGASFQNSIVDGVNRPAWYPYFTARYQVYHVLKTKWKLRIRNTAVDVDRIMEVWQRYSGAETPPYNLGASEPTPIVIKYWKGWDQKKLIYPQNAVYPYPIVTMADTYRPGDFKHDVRQDDTAKTWTLVANAPELQEYCDFYFAPSPIGAYSTTVTQGFRIDLEVELLVQFKDLIKAYKFPTSGTLADFAPTGLYI